MARDIFKDIKEIRIENKQCRQEILITREGNKTIKKDLKEAKQEMDYIQYELKYYEQERRRNNIV